MCAGEHTAATTHHTPSDITGTSNTISPRYKTYPKKEFTDNISSTINNKYSHPEIGWASTNHTPSQYQYSSYSNCQQ